MICIYTAADLGFNFRGCAKWNLTFGKHSEPPKGSWVQPQKPTHSALFGAQN